LPTLFCVADEATGAETFDFQADVSKIMDIIIHSLYSNKEIFLRELISNASDALDKIRFFALTEPEKFSVDEADLQIRVVPDTEANTLTIIDTGVGMTRDQLASELGTVARSGTSSFIEAFEQNADVSLIGQFGVGFYSVYLVADTVTVTTKHPESENAFTWESSADQTFTIAEAEDFALERGTIITLHMKEESADYLKTDTLRDILKRHSQFINYPIFLEVENEIEVTVTEEEDDDEASEADDAEEGEEGDDDGVEEEYEYEDEEERQTRTEMVKEDERINDSKPLWLRPPSEIEEEEYKEFFTTVLSKTGDDSATHIHFNAEGEVEFKSLLFVPTTAAPDAYQDYNKKQGTISLYVRRVLITDEFEDLLPNYLGFVRGVVDSDSLPLNVNRETLQQSKVLKVIGKKLVRKAIAMLQTLSTKHKKDDEYSEEEEGDEDVEKEVDEDEEEVAEDNEDYLDFFKNFGKFIKLGVAEDRSNQARLAKLLRFPSTHNADGVTGLEAYVERMKDDQPAIYYIAGDNIDALQKHPTIEKLKKLGYEVFLLTDPLDEHCLQSLAEFQSHKITDTSRATLQLDETDMDKKRQKAVEDMYKPLATWYKDVLGAEVEKVVISKRLVDSIGAVVAGDYGWTANMERIMTSQVFTNTDNMGYMKARKTFELNPAHPVVKELLQTAIAAQEAEEAAAAAQGEDDEDVEVVETDEMKAAKDSAILLYQTCLLNSGFSLPADSASEFGARLERLIRAGLNVAPDAEVEEVEVEIPESTEEESDDLDEEEEMDLDDIVEAVDAANEAGVEVVVEAGGDEAAEAEPAAEEPAADGHDEL
jgi:heat shock protein beta